MTERKPLVDSDTEEPIHFKEVYRRAKRNALFWAVVTAVLPLGQTATGTIELTPFVRDLEFNHAMIVAISFGILVFMAFGLRRAEEDTRLDNSTVAISSRLEQANDVFADLYVKATHVGQAIEGVRKAMIEKQQAAEHELEQVKGLVLTANHISPPDYDGYYQDPALTALFDPPKNWIDSVGKARDRVKEILETEWSRFFSESKVMLDAASEKLTKGIEPNVVSVDSLPPKLSTALAKLGTGIQDLSEYSKQLNDRELAWHDWMDRYIPWAVILLSCAFAGGFIAHAAVDFLTS